MDEENTHLIGEAGTGREAGLLHAMNAAAVHLQHSVRSNAEVLKAFKQQIAKLDLHGLISLLDQTRENLQIVAMAQPDPLLENIEGLTGTAIEGFSIPTEKVDIFRKVVNSGKTIFAQSSDKIIQQIIPESVEYLYEYIIQFYGAGPSIFSPLKSESGVQGVIAVQGKGLTKEDIPAVEAFANHIVIALENARLFEEARSQLLLAQTLQELGALLTAQISLTEVLETILDLLGKVVQYDSAAITMLDQDGRLLMAAGRGYPDIEKAKQISRELSDSILRSKWLAQGQAVLKDTYTSDFWVRVPETDYIRSWVGATLSVKGRLIGILSVDSRSVNAYTTATEATVKAFANQAAIAIENSRLFEAERVAHERAELVRMAVVKIDSTLSPVQVLNTILEQLARVVPFDSGEIMLLDGKKAATRAWQVREPSKNGISRDSTVFVDLSNDPVRSKVIQEGIALMVADTSQEPCWKTCDWCDEMHSWLGIPLQSRDQITGLINLYRSTPVGFTQEEISLSETIALHASTAFENARLFEAEGKRAAELEAVRQASLSVTASLELPQVLNDILKEALHLLPEAQIGHIFLYNEDGGGRLSFGAALGEEEPPEHPHNAHGITLNVAQTGKSTVISNIRTHPLYINAPNGWEGSIAGLPLKIGQSVVGVMNISNRHPHDFTEAELRVLQLLADQAAIAIENARLYEQAATERRHLGLLYEVGRELTTSLDPDEILNRAISHTCIAFNGKIGEAFLFIPEENRLSLRAIYGTSEFEQAELDRLLQFRLGKGLAGWVALARETAYVPDIQIDPRWLPIPGTTEGVASALCSPILAGEILLGVLTVLHHEKDAFSRNQVDLIQAICQEVGLALSNASRYQQVQRRLTEITLIQKLAQTFNQRLDMHVLLEEVVNQVAQQFGYPRVEILLREGDELVVKAFYGPTPKEDRISIQDGVVGRVVRNKSAALIHDVDQDPDYQSVIDNTCSELAVPIFLGEEVMGAINIESSIPDQLSEQDQELLQLLADQISVALENAVLYERVRRHAEDLEHTVAHRTAELTELYKLSQEIAYQLSFEELLRLLLRHLRKAIRSEFALGYLSPEACTTMLMETNRPVTPAVIEDIRSYLTDIAFECGGDSATQQTQFEISLTGETRKDRRTIKKAGSLIHAPIYLDDKIVGLLIAGSENENAFGAEQARLLSTFANQAKAAIQRLAAVLTAQQKHLESLVEHMPIGVLLFDADFRLLIGNPIGRQLLNLLEPGGADRPLTRLGTLSLDELIAHKDDLLPLETTFSGPPPVTIEAQVRPVGSEQPQWVLTVRDVTQERESQERIKSQERLATVGQLAAGIAHDFNNIMAAILVYADILREDPHIPFESREKLNIIQQQVQRAASLIRQILDFSRRSIMDQSSLDLLPFIKELDRLLGRVLPETIQLELTYQPGAYWIHADPTRLQQVFMNLAVNARDAMPDGGLLRFELSRITVPPGAIPPAPDMPAGNWIRINVLDTGCGIPPDVLPHIFEPFYTTKPVGLGTGLGLAQVYGIIKQHDGFIDISSQIGKGSNFSLYLPALPRPQENYTQFSTSPQPAGNMEMVLVVEDDVATREALIALLEAHNFQAVAAANGIEALKLYDESGKSIALVVSDVVMPEMGGLALYNLLRERRADIKMLFITGHPMDAKSQDLLEKDSVHWLQKPFSSVEFGLAVRSLLQEA